MGLALHALTIPSLHSILDLDMRGLFDDLRYARRAITHSRMFAIGMVVVLALGIGANTAIFGLVDAVLFRRLPVHRPAELVRIFGIGEGRELVGSSYPGYLDYRDQADRFSGVAAFATDVPLNLVAGSGSPERVSGSLVSGNFFDVLGVRAALGRALAPDDDRLGAGAPVVVLSDALWRRRFGADPRIVGTVVRLNGSPMTVIGVTPPGFVGATYDEVPEMYLPIALANQAMPDLLELKPLERRGFRWLSLIARLRPGVAAMQAESQLTAIARRVAAADTSVINALPRLVPADEASISPDRVDRAKRLSWLLCGVVGLVLLIACADAAGLLLARAERRRRELAIRLALGASRWRIVRQSLVESVGLSLLGALGGLVLAMWIGDFLAGAAPSDFALPVSVATPILHVRVLLFTAATALVTAVLFGAAPALHASDTDLSTALRGERGAAGSDGRRGVRARNALVLVQVALSAVLLVSAGLLARTLLNASAVRPGFEVEGAVVARMDLARQGYDNQRGRALYARLLDRLERTPGVRSAAIASRVPIRPSGLRNSVKIDGYEFKPGEDVTVDVVVATPGYFRTLGTPLLRGRDFDATDAPPARMSAIINQSMAEKFWPGQDPIGKHIGDVESTVVGVVADAKYHSLREGPTPVITVPMSQFFVSTASVVVRSSLTDEAARRMLTEAVAAIDPELPLFGVTTLRESMGVALAQERLLAGLLGAFAVLALVLAAAGLYSVVAVSAQSRQREWGIRMALGARAADVMRLVQRQGIVLAGGGLLAGLVIAAVATRFARALLFGVAPVDPLTYAVVAAVLVVVAIGAAWVPARRATRVDPMSTLRAD